MATSRGSDEDENHPRPFKVATTALLYDESIDVTGAEEVKTPSSESKRVSESFSVLDSPARESAGNKSTSLRKASATAPAILAVERSRGMSASRGVSAAQRRILISDQSDNSEEELVDEEDDDEDDDDDDDDVQGGGLEGTYDPNDFDHLSVNNDVKDLFQNITRYTPQNIDLEYKLKPFIPDFIPAVGDIDAFIKVARPDQEAETIGLQVLDEPIANQSEPAVLHLQLKAVAKQSSGKSVLVKRLEGGEQNSKDIDRWIRDISDLHRTKPSHTVHYSIPMPDIDSLMQEWPSECEQLLRDSGLPSPDLDCDLTKYVDIMCCLLDIPTYASRIQSVHVLLSLYSAIKNSNYFNSGMGSTADSEK